MDRADDTCTAGSLRAETEPGGVGHLDIAGRGASQCAPSRGPRPARRGSPTAEPSAPERAAARSEDLCDDHRSRSSREDRPDRAGGPAHRGHEALRRCRGGRRDRPRHRRRRVLLDARPVGIGQDDDAADDRRLRAADGGPHRAPRPGRHQRAAVRPRREHGLPGLRPVPAHDRRRQRRLRPDGPQGARGRSGSARDRRPPRWSGWRATRTASQGSCPAASASGSRSRARS